MRIIIWTNCILQLKLQREFEEKVKLSMLRLRPYNKNDAEIIMSWIKDESAFYKWTAGVLGEYPIS